MRVSYYATTTERHELIAGLRALAEFPEDHEGIPVPKWTEVMVFPNVVTDNDKRREIDRIAAMISAISQEGITGHYKATREFGPVEYRAVAIPAKQEEA
jgi:hypothetical protein